METQDYSFQEDIIEEYFNLEKTKDNILLLINCGLGKTITSLKIAREYINVGKNVAVLTYAKNEIRETWVAELLKHQIIPLEDIQVIANWQFVRNNKTPLKFVENDELETKPLNLFIPQTMQYSILKDIDVFIIDEAHEYADVQDGMVKGIIERCGRGVPKIIGLSGTGHELLKGDLFNKHKSNTGVIIRDIKFALNRDVVLPVENLLHWFDFHLKKELYTDDGELNNLGQTILKHEICKCSELKEILKSVSDHNKILVFSPRGRDIKYALKETIEKITEEKCVLKSSYSTPEENRAAEEAFRNDPNTRFMVVVDMCGTGWNFPQLSCGIDLTFTQNKKRIIQRMQRMCRYSHNKNPQYLYCADSSKPDYWAIMTLYECLELMTQEGILNWPKVKIPFNIDRFDLGHRNMISLGNIEEYFKNRNTAVKDLYITNVKLAKKNNPRHKKKMLDWWIKAYNTKIKIQEGVHL